MPKIDILNLVEKVDEQSKKIEELKEICMLLFYNQEFNSYEQINENKYYIQNYYHYYDKSGYKFFIDEMGKLIFEKHSLENGLTVLLNQANFTAELIETPKKLMN